METNGDIDEKPLCSFPWVLLGGIALCYVAGAFAYTVVQPRGFVLASRAFFEHQLLGPVFLVLAFLLGIGLVRRWEKLVITGTSAIAGFWFVVAGIGLFTGTTFYARLFALPFAGACVLCAIICYRSRRRFGLFFMSLLVGVLFGTAFWASVRAPRASTFPSSNTPRSGSSIPETEPALENGALRELRT